MLTGEEGLSRLSCDLGHAPNMIYVSRSLDKGLKLFCVGTLNLKDCDVVLEDGKEVAWAVRVDGMVSPSGELVLGWGGVGFILMATGVLVGGVTDILPCRWWNKRSMELKVGPCGMLHVTFFWYVGWFLYLLCRDLFLLEIVGL